LKIDDNADDDYGGGDENDKPVATSLPVEKH
jgi:hypothetical protein